MYYGLKQVTVLDNYKLKLLFINKEIRIFDVSPYLSKGIFKELKNREKFSKVKIVFDTIEWENGADLDPETLYLDSKFLC